MKKNQTLRNAKEYKPKKEEFRLPTFEELKSLASNYELESYLVEGKIDYRVVDIRTRKVVTNPELVERAMFANIWLSSAGVKKNITTNDRGMGYAFNEPARELYDKFCRIAYNDCMRNGVIDTLSMVPYIIPGSVVGSITGFVSGVSSSSCPSFPYQIFFLLKLIPTALYISLSPLPKKIKP